MKKYSRAQARRDLPKRSLHDNKTRGGKCLIIAGSEGMWGAAVLSSAAAARSGAGYVYLLQTAKDFPITKNPDFLALKKAKDLKTYQALAIGPGLAGDRFIKTWLKKMKSQPYAVVDASALGVLKKTKFRWPPTWILTPHEGELGKMLGVSSQTIRANRKKYVALAQKEFAAIILLKGHHTLIADGHSILEIQSGNAALAKAGTGDVLTGMITGFLSQGVPPLKAAALAAYLHGAMADHWVRSGNDVLSLLASDLVALLPQALKKLRA